MTLPFILALVCAVPSEAGLATTPAPAPLPPAIAAQILRVRGPDIVDGAGRPVLLRGVAFGNEVWSNTRLPRKEHDEVDFQRVAAMGMNVVRFYMNYKTFEADATPGTYLADGWQWLDDNIAWARKHGVYLILNMHVPPGGFQSLGNGKGLWDQPDQQQRLIKLWEAIARRTRGEPMVAGFDLLNEPVVTREPAQWRDLATRIAAAIRAVDPEHMLFVERLNAVNGRWEEDADRNFFTIPDPNTVYEFHFYKPFHFTHQSASWVPFAAEDVRYPDSRAEVEWFLTDRKAGTDDSPKLPPGDSPWTFYPGAPFTVTDPALVVGKPVLVTNANSGTVYFDDLVLEELADAKSGKVKREVWRRNLTSTRGWYFWNPTGGGGAVPGHEGHGDDKSLVAAGTRGEANLGSDVLRFHAKKGATYRLSGWMRGKEIPSGRDLPDPPRFLQRAGAGAAERQEVPRAGAGRLRRLGETEQGAAPPRRVGRDQVRVRGGSRRPALGRRHARPDARAEAALHVSRVPRGELRALPWQERHAPRSGQRQHAAHRAVHEAARWQAAKVNGEAGE